MGGSKIEFAMTKSTSKNTTPPQDLNIDWMSLFSPCPVNIETQTSEQGSLPGAPKAGKDYNYDEDEKEGCHTIRF